MGIEPSALSEIGAIAPAAGIAVLRQALDLQQAQAVTLLDGLAGANPPAGASSPRVDSVAVSPEAQQLLAQETPSPS